MRINKLLISIASTVIFASGISGFALANYEQGDFQVDPRRGSPAEYDPGPAKGSDWARLFGSTPNYRAIGEKVLAGEGEKFRWQFGPMWYRGRLGSEQVKVFVVGQEGAQDENVSNRSFTGSTGTKTQKFLNHMGIYESYLFLNTFVYTINGQLGDDPNFKWLEQDTASPIVKYRHDLFDNMIKMNRGKISVFMGVGSGGKASLATWINARGGRCSSSGGMENCDTRGLREYFANQGVQIANEILVIGVPHPGGASPANGGLDALKNIIGGFTRAAQRVAQKMNSNPNWLEPDAGDRAAVVARMNKEFRYGDAPVPFKDFAFGTNWRMGEQGTTSNRRGTDTIQVFSDKGKYNNDGHTLKYIDRRDVDSGFLERSGRVTGLRGMADEDLPYESPRWVSTDPANGDRFDYGPCGVDAGGKPVSTCELARLLQTWPDFFSGSVKPISAPAFGHGPIYRGRLNDAKVLILADQAEHDDFFSARALTGASGQRLQSWLGVVGAGASYGILRTLPVDTLGMSERDVFALASRADIVEARGKILANVLGQGKTKLMVAIGPVAGRLADALALPAGITLLKLSSADGEAHVAEWSRAVQQATQALGSTPVSTYRGQLTTIAREDLPVHSRWWMGSSGTRASRGDKQVGSAFVTNGDYYKVWAPKWVTRLRPRDLDQSMLAYLASALPNLGRSVGEGGGIVSAESYFAWEDNDRFASSDDWEYYSNDVYGRTLEELNEFLADRARGGRSGDALEGIFLPGRVAGSVILEEDTSY